MRYRPKLVRVFALPELAVLALAHTPSGGYRLGMPETASALLMDDSVTSVLRYPEDGPDPYGDHLIHVNGVQIGGTYHCQDGTWASWGPDGMSAGHATREAATSAQVSVYMAAPEYHDRRIAAHAAEQHAAAERERAEQRCRHAERTAQSRRERPGDDEPGPTTTTIPAYHAFYAPADETQAVAAWLDAHGLPNASAAHPIRVEQRATRQVIVAEVVRLAGFGTETRAVTLRVPPPQVTVPALPDLHSLFARHQPAVFALIDFGAQTACSACTSADADPTRVTAWPCRVITRAVREALAARTERRR